MHGHGGGSSRLRFAFELEIKHVLIRLHISFEYRLGIVAGGDFEFSGLSRRVSGVHVLAAVVPFGVLLAFLVGGDLDAVMPHLGPEFLADVSQFVLAMRIGLATRRTAAVRMLISGRVDRLMGSPSGPGGGDSGSVGRRASSVRPRGQAA